MIFPISAPMMEFLILGFLEKQDSYGYEICQSIKQIQETVKEPVMYPILKKLVQQGYISSYQTTMHGRQRKYYRLLPEGQICLDHMRNDWKKYVEGVDRIIKPVGGSQKERT